MQLGPDGKPGVAEVDDDGNSIVDDMSEVGWANSDDSDYERRMGKPPTHGTLADLLRYRLVSSQRPHVSSELTGEETGILKEQQFIV